MIVVSDTTPIITLLKINKLGLLRELFEYIVIPKAVYNELTSNRKFVEEGKVIKNTEYIKVVNIVDEKTVELLRRATGLDLGESEAIIFSDNAKAGLLLIDETNGRNVAKQMGIPVMGTVGILMAAYKERLISSCEIKECIDIMKNSGRHISEKLYLQLVDLIGE